MSNILIIAKKDFSDVISNPGLLMVFLCYFSLILIHVLNLNSFAGTLDQDSLPASVIGSLRGIFLTYGGIVAIITGFSMISSEKYGGTLNTVITKPLYRDTIINGKLLAGISIITMIVILSTVAYVSLIFIICNENVCNIVINKIDSILVLCILSILYSIFYLSLSMLISILIKKRSTAFLACIIALLLIGHTLSHIGIAGNLGKYVGSLDRSYESLLLNIIDNIEPNIVIYKIISYNIYNPSYNIFNNLSSQWYSVLALLLLPFLTTLLCYITFIRRDVV